MIIDGKDILGMTEEELRDVNRLVVARINELHRRAVKDKIYEFQVGQYVDFQDKYKRSCRGKIEKINKTTIIVAQCNSYHTWRMPPTMCTLSADQTDNLYETRKGAF